MPKQSRIGDIGVGTCCCHPPIPCIGMSGNIITGSANVLTNSKGTARLSDIVLGFCGHTGILVTGSPNTYTNSRNNVRIGDVFVGCFTGVIITGSDNVITN